MSPLSILILSFIAGCSATCILLNCPSFELSSNIVCSNCSSCLSQGQRFCASQRNGTCGCASSVPHNCSRLAQPSSELFTFCYVPEPITLPPPEVHPEGSLSLSVAVQRFFSKEEFERRKPSNLLLIARFFSEKPVVCRDMYSIHAQRRSEKECVLRVKLAMPGIDHKTDDHYYYDDGTNLEANFSLEIFEGAKEAEFWTEVTLQHEEGIEGDKLFFYSLIRSPVVRQHLQECSPRNDNTTDSG